MTIDDKHSVLLYKKRCVGCTNCVKRCPTEAIRVTDGKAVILSERCIDCGECIKVCPHHAKKGMVDSLATLDNYSFTIALVDPAFYGQFPRLRDRNLALTALKSIGFDYVFEVATACEAISNAVEKDLEKEEFNHPIINSSCPAVIRIIRSQYPSLLPYISEYRSPMEIAAKWAKQEAMKKYDLDPEKIGCIYISPCTAKCTAARLPLGTLTSGVDAVVSISEVFPLVMSEMGHIIEPQIIAQSGTQGIAWGASGGESEAFRKDGTRIVADGVENVLDVLEALENGKVHDIRFVELTACAGGCVGGVLNAENPFIAKSRLDRIMLTPTETIPIVGLPEDYLISDKKILPDESVATDEDMFEAIRKIKKLKSIESGLSGLDCGACGAPSCKALAEDIVNGKASEEQCVFVMRNRLETLEETVEEIQRLQGFEFPS